MLFCLGERKRRRVDFIYIIKINTNLAGQQTILATERGREGAIAISSTNREYDVGTTSILTNDPIRSRTFTTYKLPRNGHLSFFLIAWSNNVANPRFLSPLPCR
jgi:hypothetical protein